MNIAIPHFIFGSLVGGLIGSLIHLILGGKPIRLIFSILFSWIGFWAGNSIAGRLQIFLFRYGTIDFGMGVVSAVILGIIGYWVSGENNKNKDDVN